MAETLRDKIIASPSAAKMLERVSPIYDNSYVGLWLFEAIGREYDSLREIVDTFHAQLFPQSVTWAIELWEQRYGIVPGPLQTLEERRAAIKAARSKAMPFVPFVLEQYIYNVTGRRAEVVDHIADFTFGVHVDSTDGMRNSVVDELEAYINRFKHSHMSYDLVFQSSSRVVIGVETGYWRFPYSMTGSAKAGQRPEASTVFTQSKSEIVVDINVKPYRFPYELAGTKPDVNTEGAIAMPTIRVSPDARAFIHEYPMAGQSEAGVEPEYTMTGSVDQSSIRASLAGKAYGITYAMCGGVNAGAGGTL